MEKLTIDDVYKYYHAGFIKINDDIASRVISDFESIIGNRIEFFTNSTDFDGSENLCKMIALKNGNVARSIYLDDFYSILKSYGYFMKHDIIYAIQRLGNLKDKSKMNEVISLLLKSPVIDDISFDGEYSFTIYSRQFGEYPFYLASEYYNDNQALLDYLNANKNISRCHVNTFNMSSMYPELYVVTSLCRFYFVGSYYHSYSYDEYSDNVTDLCANSVMKKACFDSLYYPKVLNKVVGARLSGEFERIFGKIKETDGGKVLKIALHNQLNSLTEEEICSISKGH